MRVLLNNSLLNSCSERILNSEQGFLKTVAALLLLFIGFVFMGFERLSGLRLQR